MFLKATEEAEGQERPSVSNDVALRGGELDDLNAMLETHFLNTCLDAVALPARFNYVTLSTRMFNFVRRFDEKTLRAPLVHPRTALMMQNSQLFEEHQTDLAGVLTAAIAYGDSIPSSNEISMKSLSVFERDYSAPLGAIRNTFLHSIADSKAEREQLIDALKLALDSIELNEDQIKKREQVYGIIDRKFSSQVVNVGNKYKSSSDTLGAEAWDAYEGFAKSGAREKKLLIRTSRNGPVQRLACLPTAGSFRYMFVLHNQFLKFSSKEGSSFASSNVEAFLAEAGLSATRELARTKLNELEKSQALALKLFAQAIFSASNREWALAEVKATKAHLTLDVHTKIGDLRAISKLDLHDSNSINWERVRSVQFDQEVMFLRHLCARAGAEASTLPNRRLRWLVSAGDDLAESAAYTLNLSPIATGVTAQLDPVSIRQALAAVALRIEWLVAHKGNLPERHLPALPATQRKDLAWYGLDLLCSTERLIDVDQLDQTCVELIQRVKSAFEELLHGQDLGLHSIEFWRYFLLRAHSLRLLLHVCADVKFTPKISSKTS